MDDNARFPVEPEQVWTLEGGVASYTDAPAETDVTYFAGAEITRVVQAAELPYTFVPEAGETHVAWSVRVGDVSGGTLYID